MNSESRTEAWGPKLPKIKVFLCNVLEHTFLMPPEGQPHVD